MIGLEPTWEEHLSNLVAVFREVRRVLRKDGTLWVNYGDGYSNAGTRQGGLGSLSNPGQRVAYIPRVKGLKNKDLMLMPARVAIALQEPVHTGPIKQKVDRAWMAGLIDADGSIGIRRQNPRPERHPSEKNPSFIPYLSVSQSDTVALERCVELTGLGKINMKKKAGTTDHRGIVSRRDFYTWRLDGQIASRVIRDIYPYLVIKPIQAQIAHTLNLSMKKSVPFKSVPPKVIREREALYETCKAVNQRKVVDLPKLALVLPAEEPMFYLRSEIIWHKPNPMPESVRDRPTSAHEKLFLLSRSAKYFYDADAVRVPAKQESLAVYAGGNCR